MRQPIAHTIKKVDHWPLGKQREYLRLAFETERDARRRRAISKALRDVTTKVLRRRS